jgi:hypothetical protein
VALPEQKVVVDGDRGDALDVISVAVIATVLQASAAKLAT